MAEGDPHILDSDVRTFDVKISIIPPSLSPERKTRALTPSPEPPPPDSRLTRLPAQPDDVPQGYVFAGSNFGHVPYSGTKPQAGDLIAVVGNTARQYVTSPLAGESQRWPTFLGGCSCKCPSPLGTVAVLEQVAGVAQVLLIDALTTDLHQIVGAAELGFQGVIGVPGGPAIAFDTATPYDLYALDDLRTYQAWVTDQQPVQQQSYFRLNRWRVASGQYVFLDRYNLAAPVALDPLAVQAGGSCLAVHDHVVTITLLQSPARYLHVIDMTSQEMITLTRNGVPYTRALRGNFVQVIQKPGKTADRYVLARQGAGAATQFELLRVNAQHVVTGVVQLGTFNLSGTTPVAPVQVVVACNQLLVLTGQVSQEIIGVG